MKIKHLILLTTFILANPILADLPQSRAELIVELLNLPPGNSICNNSTDNSSFEECVERLKVARRECPKLISNNIPEKLNDKERHLLFGRSLVCKKSYLEGSEYQNSDWDDVIMQNWKEPQTNADAIKVNSYIYKETEISLETWSYVCDQDPEMSTMSCLTPPKELNTTDGCVKTPGLCFYTDENKKFHSFILTEGVIVFYGEGKSFLKAKELAKRMDAQIRLYESKD